MPWGPDVETNLAISSANHLKVRFIQQSQLEVHLHNSKGDSVQEVARTLGGEKRSKQQDKNNRDNVAE
ncbi:hypothetical protein E3U36_11105 [Arsenophonus endosymbiont of Aphis craccivora]|uniref:hypothetical protein n=1 Tax=Arsenophonus endosymbiont of Aphis craccivora TaxID=1231049 RepID=UPI0015DC631E|nr:hypothetical protein [Arsenophonus endosymbiont of Aphis craccivora]QLK88452.1 hypothetical protein E3U36_11105 [Arsenophonus endosymbiont of Aphis craccivora]